MNGRLVGATAMLAIAALTSPLASQQPTEPAAVYARQCASCHGATGAPNPAMVRSLGAMPDFSDARVMAAFPDSVLIAVVTAGKGRSMPAYRTRLTPDQVRALVAYVRTLSRPPSR